MVKEILLNTIYLTKNIIMYPNRAFVNIRERNFLNEVLLVFLFGALITLIKSFSQKGKIVNFFEYHQVNEFLTVLSIPQVLWITSYASYFIFIFIMLLVCRVFKRQIESKHLVLSIMSLSGVGVVIQILFYAFKFVFPQEYLIIGSNIIFLWVVILSIWAIKATQNFSVFKSIICFLIPALPFIFLVYLAGMAPYLMWLGY
jgi:hypothetical protein